MRDIGKHDAYFNSNLAVPDAPWHRLVEDKRRKKRSQRSDKGREEEEEGGVNGIRSRSPPRNGIPLHGYMRKCNNPFTEGWKVATFKPAREKLVPYMCSVRKFWKDRGYGFLDYRGQQVFVHVNDIKVRGLDHANVLDVGASMWPL